MEDFTYENLYNVKTIFISLLVVAIIIGVWVVFAKFGQEGKITLSRDVFFFR